MLLTEKLTTDLAFNSHFSEFRSQTHNYGKYPIICTYKTTCRILAVY